MWSYNKAIGYSSDWPPIYGCSSVIDSSRACCGENACRKVENVNLPVYYDQWYHGFLIARPNQYTLVVVSTWVSFVYG